VIVNVAFDEPAGTVMLVGTVAADGLLEDRLTTAPPEGAAPFSATVPWKVLPPTTLPGLIDKPETIGGITASDAEWLIAPQAAVIFGFEVTATGLVAITNVALEDPAGTVTETGTVATEVVSDVKFTFAPPLGAVALNVTVPCAEVPPRTLSGLIVMDDKTITTEFGTNVRTVVALVAP